MPVEISRRKFITNVGIAAGGLSFSSFLATTRKAGIVPDMSLAYSAITWGGNDAQAIKDIASLGFKGIQLRSNVLKDYGTKPDTLRDMLAQNKLYLPMFSSGNANIKTGDDQTVIDTHVNNAKFVKTLGGSNIQVTNSSRPKQGAPTKEDLVKYGKLIDEIGKRTLDVGVQTNYHNHMHQLGETPEEVTTILENCDSKNVRFLLDIAHYFQGGGDPVKALNTYKDRISALHLKDVRPNAAGSERAYTFVELGQGKVDLPGVFKALNNIGFKGWGIVELDSVPDKTKTPVECANITKAYLKAQGIKI
jgi:inosose dehydratase